MNASPQNKRGTFNKHPDFNKKILVVEDEPAMLQTIRYNLERSGYAVDVASDGRVALDVFNREEPDLVILDVMLPGLDGIEVCKEIRKVSSVPIIMLTAKDQEIDKVLALELGADDYVTKPFALHEFLARVKARLRRPMPLISQDHDRAIRLGQIVLDPSRQQLMVRGDEVQLAPKEFSLLRVLMENSGRVVTRQTLLDKVWGYDFEGEQQTVSVHIRWLREKIEEDSANPRHIITVRSRGYMFKE
jgi:DNA-binding response OmpR family regulator